MKSEKGFTLVETVAVVLISALFIGLSFTTFSFIRDFWSTSNQNYSQQANFNKSRDVLTKYFNYAVDFYMASSTEFRFKTGYGSGYTYKAVRLSNNRLTMYNLSSVDDSTFKGTLTDSNYTDSVILADNVTQMLVRYGGITLTGGSDYKSGEELSLFLTYNAVSVAISGKQTTSSEVEQIDLKLLVDS